MNVKALVGACNWEKALVVGAFSVIVKLKAEVRGRRRVCVGVAGDVWWGRGLGVRGLA